MGISIQWKWPSCVTVLRSAKD